MSYGRAKLADERSTSALAKLTQTRKARSWWPEVGLVGAGFWFQQTS